MPSATTPVDSRVHRVEVRPQPVAGDPRADDLMHAAARSGVPLVAARSARVYLIEGRLGSADLRRIVEGLLCDPVAERATIGQSGSEGAIIEIHPLPGVTDPPAQTVRDAILELIGVDCRVSTGWRYDLDGVSSRESEWLAQRLLANPVVNGVHTQPFHPEHLPVGHTYDFELCHIPIRDLDDDELRRLARDAHLFLDLHEMRAIRDEYTRIGREPTDIELETLAQTWSEHCVHKTLKANIRYRDDATMRRCHEGARSVGDRAIDWSNRPGHTVNPDGSITIDNLLKSTVAAATHELIADGVDWTLSVFVDNAGIIRFDDHTAVCVKVETHNHPSAIEPYGGAATGIGGCIRDIMGTGLAAKPIASTNVFCVAHPDGWDPVSTGNDSSESCPTKSLPSGCLYPRRILTEVVAGVRDYGNRMGIPTVNGAVWFDDRYVGNPLVFCGSVGVMPANMTHGDAQRGDLIVALGGRTGRDGIHGATFSSAELTDSRAHEFGHAVQIGNAIEQKRTLDAILRARDFVPSEASGIRHQASERETERHVPDPNCPLPIAYCLFSAITDCGAGGFSSAVGEMGEQIGAEVNLDQAPLKYEGLSYTEIWISEAQERMVLAVPPTNLDALQQICDEEHVELCVLGTFGTPHVELVLRYEGTEVGRLPMKFLHEGIPTPTREATWNPERFNAENAEERGVKTDPKDGEDRKRSSIKSSHSVSSPRSSAIPTTSALKTPSTREALLALLAHPNIASKHWIVRQYDYEVQGRTVVKPLVGPMGRGPSDAAVIEPNPGSGRGLAIGCGLATGLGDPSRGGDPYEMALAAIDECVRNLVCVGADPDRIAILDNFCWPSCTKPENLGSLVRAAEGCYDGAKAYRTPFVSGKDSLNNQFTTDDGRTIEIPPTLLITGIGIVQDLSRVVTMDLKKPGNPLYVVEPERDQCRDNGRRLGGSHYAQLFGIAGDDLVSREFPLADPNQCAQHSRVIAEAIRRGFVASCHDSSDGGPLVAIAEMLIAGSTPSQPIGANWLWYSPESRHFSERPGCYVLEVLADRESEFKTLMDDLGGGWTRVGDVTANGTLSLGPDPEVDIPVEELASAWRGTLDW